MEFFALAILAGLAALAIKVNKTRARKRFRQAVEDYERARDRCIREGESPLSIPAVEMFLADRGELHLLSQINRSITNDMSDPAVFRFILSLETEEHASSDDFDDGYKEFVAQMWAKDGVCLEGYILSRVTEGCHVECKLHSLVTGNRGSLYLNLWEGDLRKTYAADYRHKWVRDGHLIDNSAFVGILKGASPEQALQREPYAASFEQAISTAYDRVESADKKHAIAYLSDKGLSYRVVSRVIRQTHSFSARCHFRWGERRTFDNSGLIAVFDLQANKNISVRSFLLKRGKRRA